MRTVSIGAISCMSPLCLPSRRYERTAKDSAKPFSSTLRSDGVLLAESSLAAMK